jgi:hypothetical protein
LEAGRRSGESCLCKVECCGSGERSELVARKTSFGSWEIGGGGELPSQRSRGQSGGGWSGPTWLVPTSLGAYSYIILTSVTCRHQPRPQHFKFSTASASPFEYLGTVSRQIAVIPPTDDLWFLPQVPEFLLLGSYANAIARTTSLLFLKWCETAAECYFDSFYFLAFRQMA